MNNEAVLEEEQKSRYTGGAIVRSLMKWLSVIVSIITLSLALPAMVCWRERYECRHTYIDNKQLRFDGHALQLLGKFVLWVLLTVITFGIYGFWLSIKKKKWKTKHTHFADEPLDAEALAAVKKSKDEVITAMTEEERADYEQKINGRKRTAHSLGLVALILTFFMPPWGLILGVAGIVFSSIYKEKFGIRTSTIAVSILSLAATIVIGVICESELVIFIVAACCVAAAAIAAIVTVFIVSRRWENAPKPENN